MGFRPFRLFRMPSEFQLLLMLLPLQNKTKVLISLSLFYKKQCFSFTKDSFEDAVYIVWQKQKTPISWEKWTIWGLNWPSNPIGGPLWKTPSTCGNASMLWSDDGILHGRKVLGYWLGDCVSTLRPHRLCGVWKRIR